MSTFFLMGILLLCMAGVVLFGIKYNGDTTDFWLFDYTKTLKGIFCIVIVLVHTPVKYQNPIQDMIGSFAYIGVTFFFMASAYGLKYGYDHKRNYFNHFWRNRLSTLFVPMFLANIIFTVISRICFPQNDSNYLKSIITVNSWVKMLILFYILFYIVYRAFPNEKDSLIRDKFLCVLVIITSIVQRIIAGKIDGVWPTECLGFAYGILLARHFDYVKTYLNKKMIKQTVGLLILSLMIGVLYLTFKDIYILGDYLLKIILGVTILSLLFIVTSKLKIGNKAGLFLGTISYEIYLVHGKVFGLMEKADITIESGAFIILAILLTICSSVVIHCVSKPLIHKIRR